MDFRGKRLPDGSYVSALTAEYPSGFASAVINIISPWVTKSALMNQDLSKWRSLLSRNPISKGPRITDGAGDASSANCHSQRIFSNPFDRCGSNASLQPNYIPRLLMRAEITNLNHLSQKMNLYLSSTIYNTHFHPSHSTSPFQIINPSVFTCSTHYYFSPRVLIHKSPLYFKKAFHQVLSRNSNQWGSGKRTAVSHQTTLTLSYAMTTGPVPTTIQIQHAY